MTTTIRRCRYCGEDAGAGTLCSRVPGSEGLAGSHSYEDVDLDADNPADHSAILAAATDLGFDVEAERCDWSFVLDAVRELEALPELERPAALRAVNDGARVSDRHAYAS